MNDKQFTINVAFATDIITNSSSVVYSQAVGVDSMYDLLDEVISALGSDKKARDIFEISIQYSNDLLQDWVKYNYENEEFQTLLNQCNDWREKNQIALQKAHELLESGKLTIDSDFYEGRFNSDYLVKVKGKNTEIGKKVANLFSTWGEYEG